MRQSILNAGDFVKYHIESSFISGAGFKKGRSYQVETNPDGALVVSLPNQFGELFFLTLVSSNGELTDVSDHFTKVKTQILAKGQGQSLESKVNDKLQDASAYLKSLTKKG